jgi:hypothetical protein
MSVVLFCFAHTERTHRAVIPAKFTAQRALLETGATLHYRFRSALKKCKGSIWWTANRLAFGGLR